MFVLYWDAAENKVFALNGSGRSGKDYSIDKVRSDLGISDGETGSIPATSPHSVTVPGAAAGWVDTVEKFGSAKVDMAQILAPAIRLGEDGFPVSEIASYYVSRKIVHPVSQPRAAVSRPGHFHPCIANVLIGNPFSNWTSGTSRNRAYGMHLPTIPRCSRRTRMPPMVSELRRLERL